MTPSATTPQPRFLFLAAAVLFLEALLMIGFGVVEALSIRPSRMIVGAGAAVLALGYGAFLAATGRGVLLGRRWSRGPAVATQLLHLPVAWSFMGDPTTGFAWGLILASVVSLVCLVVPASTAIFLEEPVSEVEGSASDAAEAGPDDTPDPAATR